MLVGPVNLKGGFCSFSFSADHVQIVTAFARSLSRAAITAWDFTYECILMIRIRSSVSFEKSRYSSPQMFFFILAPMASNDEFLVNKV